MRPEEKWEWRAKLGALPLAIRSWSSTRAARLALEVSAALAYVTGLTARYLYVLRFHHPRHAVVTDIRSLVDLAQKMIEAPSSATVRDTIWPPGTSALLAVSLARDPTAGTAAVIQLALSCTLPLVVAHTGFLVGGRSLALLALTFASLHSGFIHCTGFFLSEQLFQFAVAVAIWTSVAALFWDDARTQSELRSACEWEPSIGARIACGFAAGVSWGLATSFRPNALPVALLVGIALGQNWWRLRHRRALWMLVGGGIGLASVVMPLAHRCAVLRGPSLCPVSSNFAMNVALGQLDDAVGIDFFDPLRPDLDTHWSPPGLVQHGYTGHVKLPFSIFDTRRIMRWVCARIWQDPERFALRVVRNVIDLFRVETWPKSYGPIPPAAHLISGWVFLVVAVIPGLVGFRRAGKLVARGLRAPSLPATASLPLFFFAVLLAVMAVAGCSLGEPRYRYPFDGVLILLAGMVLLRRFDFERGPSPGMAPQRRWSVMGMAFVAPPTVGVGMLIALVSWPSSEPLPFLRNDDQSARVAGEATVRAARDFERLVPTRSAWNASGNYVFSCAPDCRELVLRFDHREHARAIELSVDYNDRYRVFFYRDDSVIAHADLPRESQVGMRVILLEVPGRASNGYDAIGVLPLYGDGFYSFGHLRVL